MTALKLTMTVAGLSRFTAAQASDDIDLTIARVGLTDAAFAVSPTLTALPGEFRRLSSVSGSVEAQNIVHMTIEDAETTSYSVRGFGLFLADGTLFAVYGQATPIVQKAANTTLALAIDVAFPVAGVENITFGGTSFLNPPGTTGRKGVVRLATPAEVAAGVATDVVVTPADLRRVLPLGSIQLWYGAEQAVPSGWVVCNGQTVARSDGVGNITTPDLRGRAAVGADAVNAAGTAFGAASRTVDTTAGGAHGHTGTAAGHTHRVQATGSTTGAASGAAMTSTVKNDVAGGGSGRALENVSLAIDVASGASAPADLTISNVGNHQHKVTMDVTQPSFALHFIMKV
jgi:hypothetical protein